MRAAAKAHLAVAAPPEDHPSGIRTPRRRVGKVEGAVRRDLKRLPKAPPGELSSRATLSEAALVLARAIDAMGTNSPSTLGKLIDSLRLTMDRIVEVATGDADSPESGFQDMATPVFDSPDS